MDGWVGGWMSGWVLKLSIYLSIEGLQCLFSTRPNPFAKRQELLGSLQWRVRCSGVIVHQHGGAAVVGIDQVDGLVAEQICEVGLGVDEGYAILLQVVAVNIAAVVHKHIVEAVLRVTAV